MHYPNDSCDHSPVKLQLHIRSGKQKSAGHKVASQVLPSAWLHSYHRILQLSAHPHLKTSTPGRRLDIAAILSGTIFSNWVLPSNAGARDTSCPASRPGSNFFNVCICNRSRFKDKFEGSRAEVEGESVCDKNTCEVEGWGSAWYIFKGNNAEVAADGLPFSAVAAGSREILAAAHIVHYRGCLVGKQFGY